jgi:hypothetical protein
MALITLVTSGHIKRDPDGSPGPLDENCDIIAVAETLRSASEPQEPSVPSIPE